MSTQGGAYLMALSDPALMALTPPARDTLQMRVYQELRKAIMKGRFAPGRPLTIRAVADALGTSPMPVREALRQLTTEHAVDTLPNRSFGTPVLSRSRFRDVLSIRTELEGYATERATKQISKSSIEILESIEEQMAQAEGKGEREYYIELNQAFHFEIYRAAESEVLIPLIETLWLQVGPYIQFVFTEGTHSKVPHTFHQGIINALKKRNPEQARKMLVADITSAAEIIQARAEFLDE